MLLVDEIVERGEKRIVCRKTFREDEFFFQGHYPGAPLVPGVILLEATMQAGAVLLSHTLQDADGVPVSTRMNNVKFKKMVKPGDTVDLEAVIDDQVSDAYFLTGKITCEGKLAARFEFAVTIAPVRAGAPVP